MTNRPTDRPTVTYRVAYTRLKSTAIFLPCPSQKRHASVADRSFVMGTIGEIGDAMGSAVADFVPTFYPIVHGGIKDEDEEVIVAFLFL